MRTRWLDVPGARLAVAEYGDPAAPAVAVAHGVGSTKEFAARCWAGAVIAAGWRLACYDLRGHGESTPLPDPAAHALDAHAGDLAAVAAATGARLVGGLSLGAHAAVRAAARGLPASGLLLALPGWLGAGVEAGAAGPGESPGAAAAAANDATAAAIERDGVGAVITRAAADPGVHAWVVDELRDSWPRHDPASLVAAFRAVAREPAPADSELRRVAMPVAVVGVTDDPGHPLAAAVAYARELPRATLVTTSLAEWGERRSLVGTLALRAWQALAGENVSGSR